MHSSGSSVTTRPCCLRNEKAKNALSNHFYRVQVIFSFNQASHLASWYRLFSGSNLPLSLPGTISGVCCETTCVGFVVRRRVQDPFSSINHSFVSRLQTFRGAREVIMANRHIATMAVCVNCFMKCDTSLFSYNCLNAVKKNGEGCLGTWSPTKFFDRK